MKFPITKLYYNILSILLINIIISCNAKDCEKLHMQSVVLDKKDNDQVEISLNEKMNNEILNFKNTNEFKLTIASTLPQDFDTKYLEELGYEEVQNIYNDEIEILTSQYSDKNTIDPKVPYLMQNKIKKEKYGQIINKIIENYLKDEPIYQIVRNNEKLVDLINPVSIQEVLLQKFNKLPKSYTKLFKKCPSSILNLITNYYITYSVEEELVKLTESLQNIKLYEYYENFKKNLFHTTNNDRVLNTLKIHIEYLKKIKQYIENVKFYKPMYKNELTNIENFCSLFKNINTEIKLEEYKKDIQFTEKQELLLHDFSFIKSTKKNSLKNSIYFLKYIKSKSQIRSWVFDFLFFKKLVDLKSVTYVKDMMFLMVSDSNLLNGINQDHQLDFYTLIPRLCDYSFGSLFLYLSEIYPCLKLLFSIFIKLKFQRSFKYYFIKKAINQISEYKTSISNISEFKELKNFIKEKSNFDNVLLNKFIEQKAVDILLSNNITKTQAENHEFIKSLLEYYVLDEEQVSAYNQTMINYIKYKYESFLNNK